MECLCPVLGMLSEMAQSDHELRAEVVQFLLQIPNVHLVTGVNGEACIWSEGMRLQQVWSKRSTDKALPLYYGNGMG